MSLRLRIDGWDEGAPIPRRFTCDGDGRSPAVAWQDAPAAARSLVLALVDPDAPRPPFVHWLIFNLPAAINALPEWLDGLPEGAQEGTNGFGALGYGAPCPPPGERHRYVFELHALAGRLQLSEGVGYRQVAAAMAGRVLASDGVTGTYGRASGRRDAPGAHPAARRG